MNRENRDATYLVPGAVRRYATVVGLLVFGVALVGFLRGVREPPPVSRQSEPVAAFAGTVPQAVRYDELAAGPLVPRQRSMLANLKRGDVPDVFAPVIRTEAMKLQALADRAKNRAYDGAPPTIPHSVDPMNATNCLLCHGEGMLVNGRVATKISHPHYPNCTQCHVELARSGLPEVAVTENEFVGAWRSGAGERASPGAPPTIPHTTLFRQDCLSCHGLLTRAGTRTTHPWLANCTQCHVPSAKLDQLSFLESEP